MLSKSYYSNISSSSQIGSHSHNYHHKIIPMPNFKEYIMKLRTLDEQKKGNGQVFAGSSFVGEI